MKEKLKIAALFLLLVVLILVDIRILLGLLVLSFIFLKFTLVNEGTAKAVMRMGSFRKFVMAWENHYLDDNYNCKKSKKNKKNKPPFGGLRFVGIRFIDKVYKYKFSWTSITHEGEAKVHKDENLDYIILKPDVYLVEVKEAEDKNLLPVDIKAVVTIEINNPYKALFMIQDWFEAVVHKIKPAVRNFITSDTYENLIRDKEDIGRDITDTLEKENFFKEFNDNYGVSVKKIEVMQIDPPKEYLEATVKPWYRGQEAKARAVETVGAVINMIAEATGKSSQEIQEEIKNNPEVEKEFKKMSQDLICREMALDKGAFLDIRTQNSLQDVIAIWKKILSTGGSNEAKSKTEAKKDDVKDKMKGFNDWAEKNKK